MQEEKRRRGEKIEETEERKLKEKGETKRGDEIQQREKGQGEKQKGKLRREKERERWR